MREQSRCFVRKCRKGEASSSERALPPPSAPPKERSRIQIRELWACETKSQRKTSEGFRFAQRLARTLVACEKLSLPIAKAEPLTAPAEAPPMTGKGLPLVWTRLISPSRLRTPA